MRIFKPIYLISITLTIFTIAFAVFAQTSKTKNSRSVMESKASSTFSPSPFEEEILREINLLRTDPTTYAKNLDKLKASMQGKTLVLPGGDRLMMNEGAPAISEAVNALKRVTKLGKLEYSSGLSLAAKAQLNNLKADISLGHMGTDGSDVTGRLFKVGFPGKFTAENIALYSKSGTEAVFQMVVDDGLTSRVHRINLLKAEYKLVGIAFGTGKNNVEICVLVFADKFKDR
jgi:uncharacterized protein YkwD